MVIHFYVNTMSRHYVSHLLSLLFIQVATIKMDRRL